MKQGESKRLQPKDKHSKESWKRRDAGRKGKQEQFALSAVLASQDAPETTNGPGEGAEANG